MIAQDIDGHRMHALRRCTRGLFQLLENQGPLLEQLRLLLIRFVYLRVNAPAKMIVLLSVLALHILQLLQSEKRINNLHAGIVNVILDFRSKSCAPEHSIDNVAQNGIPQMPDMHRLVRVHIRMLDNDFLLLLGERIETAYQFFQRRQQKRRFEEKIHETRSRNDNLLERHFVPQFRRQFLGKLHRVLIPLLGDDESEVRGKIAVLLGSRHFNPDGCFERSEHAAAGFGHVCGNNLDDIEHHDPSIEVLGCSFNGRAR